jgi:glycosyltransferase involved in cell wall biosynthesis
MTNITPRVSVIIPAYNGDKYIVQAVESVINQTYKNREIIIIDDGSTDNTRQVLQPYLDTIRYLHQTNQGVAAARNCGIREAKGELIAFLDQDDFFFPDKLAAQVALFDTQTSLGIVNSGWRLVNDEGEKLFDIKPWKYLPKLNLETWVVYMPILPSAMMFSKHWLEQVGGFDSQYDSVDDADLILRLALSGCEAAWLTQVTVAYRQHGQNVSIQRALKQANLFIKVKQNLFNRADLPENIRQLEKPAFYEALTWMAWQLYYSGHPAQMAEYLQQSLSYTPYSLSRTIVDWVKRLTEISQAYGCEIDGFALRNLLEWKQLITNILPVKTVRFSVIISAYNCDKHIVQALDSIINQTYQNWEIIVIDDGSTDNTRKALSPYLDLIQYIYQAHQGEAIARNRGCQLAQGEFLAFLDGADFFLPEKLEKQLAYFDTNPALAMVQTGWLIVDEKGQDIHPVMPWQRSPKLDLETFISYKNIRLSAIMLRRKWWQKLGGFDAQFLAGSDLDFALRLALQGGKAVWLEEILICARQQKDQIIYNESNLLKNMEKIMENFFARPDLPQNLRQLKNKERYESLTWTAWQMYRDQNFTEMGKNLETSLDYSQFSPTETILNWVDAFKFYALESGNNFDANSLSLLPAWQAAVTMAMNHQPQSNAATHSSYRQHHPHILLYTEDHGVGGMAQFNHALLCKLATAGYDVTCVQTETSNPLIFKEKELGIRHIWLGFDTMKEFSRIAYNQTDAENIFSQNPPDLIVFSDGWPMANFAAKQVAIKMDIPYIIALGYIDPSYSKFSRWDRISYLDAVSYHYTIAKAVVAVSSENLKLCKKMFKMPQNWGKVIYYGRPDSYFTPPMPTTRKRLRAEVGIPEDAVVCFTAARLTPVKGYQYQLEAIAQLKDSPIWSKIYFVWAGPGATTHDNLEPKLRETVINLGVSNQVKFLGQRWDISDWLDASDIFILPSKAEGMPLAIMEAMAKGLPVIATAVSGIPEELGETGKLLPNPNFDPKGTVKELASTIESWVANSELRQSVGEKCKARAETMFREERMVQEYIDVIAQALLPDKNEDKASLNPRLAGQVKLLESRLRYCSLVWNAWQAHRQGNIAEMFDNLKESLNCTPFFATETILYWVQNFANFYAETGQNFDSYSLINSAEWQELIASVLGDATPVNAL